MPQPRTEPADLTTAESDIATKYVRMMDFLSRCVRPLEAGDWTYLSNKVGDVHNAARELERATIAQDIEAEPERPQCRRR